MSEKLNKKEPIDKPDEKRVELTSEQDKQPSLGRRAVFHSGFVGLFSLLTQACSADFSTGFSSGGIGRKAGERLSGNDAKGDRGSGRSDAGDGDGEGDETDSELIFDAGGDDDSGDEILSGGTGDEDGSFDSDKDIEDCRANNTQMLDVSKHPEPPSDLIPNVKFYGVKSGSSMIAFQFETSEDIESVTVLMDSGQMLAFHRLTGGDKNGGTYRAIQIDNLFLNNTTNVKLLIKSDGKHFVHTETIEYFKTYKGKPVLDYSEHTIPAGYTMASQSVTQFDGPTTAFDSDDTVTYPAADGTPGARTLLTATKNTTWTQGAGIKGEVTDIMGNAVSLNGKGITKHQTFCTYVDNGTAYCRTIMKIG